MPRISRENQIWKSFTFHIINRGVLKQTIFHDERDYLAFLAAVSRYARKAGAKVYHWCLMDNHYHLLLELPNPLDVSKMVGCWQQVYAVNYHRRYRTAGQFFQSRFKSQAIEKESYLVSCGRYIEQNPVRAGFCQRAWEWPWSSAGFYAMGTADLLTSRNPQWEGIEVETYRQWLQEQSTEHEQMFRSARETIVGPDMGRLLLRESGRYMPRRRGRRPKGTFTL